MHLFRLRETLEREVGMDDRKAINRYTTGIYLVMFTMSVCNTIQSPLLTVLIDHYQLKSAMQGILSSFQSIGSLVALFIAVFVTGKVGKPAIMLTLSLLFVLSMLGAATMPAFFVLVIFYMVFGIAKGLTDAATSSSIADLYDGRTTARRMGVLHGVFGIGGLLAPILIVQLLRTGMPWNYVYLVFAIFSLLSLIAFSWIYNTARQTIKPLQRSSRIDFSAVKAFSRSRRNWLLLGATFAFAVCQIGYFLWISRYVEVRLGDAPMGAVALSLFWIGTAASRIFLPRLKMPSVRIIIWGNLLAGIFALAGIWSMSIPVILVTSLLVGITSGAAISLLLYIGCTWMRENTMFMTTAICPPMVGAINAAAGMSWGMTAALLFALLSSLCFLPLRKEKI